MRFRLMRADDPRAPAAVVTACLVNTRASLAAPNRTPAPLLAHVIAYPAHVICHLTLFQPVTLSPPTPPTPSNATARRTRRTAELSPPIADVPLTD